MEIKQPLVQLEGVSGDCKGGQSLFRGLLKSKRRFKLSASKEQSHLFYFDVLSYRVAPS